ncbi:MAG: Npt1/Npt2 family nucleotide transporter [Desulfococcaceae bacterium]|jgi:AAA family ATP:ADP antiporter|nr:Npt1/Npt2 family nucleotide transporter [Desulfococcaceae bacterium]
MFISPKERSRICSIRYPALRKVWLRSVFLFLNFFLITMALYHLKPASRSLFIDLMGADKLPYVWIGTAISMIIFIPFYNCMVADRSRFHVVLGTCMSVIVLLLLFRFMLLKESGLTAVAFYIFVDISGVVLVEQFWSLCNSVYNTEEGKRWYGIVGIGGPLGGVVGGWTSVLLLRHTQLQTPDLLPMTCAVILLTFNLTWIMGKIGLYCEVDSPLIFVPGQKKNNWRFLSKNRYLLLITVILLLAQLASPLVDYQFLKTVESNYPDRELRTEFLGFFSAVINLVAIIVNIGITPVVHRGFGVIAGLLIQPLMMTLCSFGFLLHPTLFWGTAAKISDRGLFNSINRASKELLYVPIDPVLIYQAKAWIDMFGFRIFKVFGSLLILSVTNWLPFRINVRELGWFTVCICAVWIILVLILKQDYRMMIRKFVRSMSG